MRGWTGPRSVRLPLGNTCPEMNQKWQKKSVQLSTIMYLKSFQTRSSSFFMSDIYLFSLNSSGWSLRRVSLLTQLILALDFKFFHKYFVFLPFFLSTCPRCCNSFSGFRLLHFCLRSPHLVATVFGDSFIFSACWSLLSLCYEICVVAHAWPIIRCISKISPYILHVQIRNVRSLKIIN